MARLEVSVRPATAADIRPLAAVLSRAFEDDPPFVWMLPDARTRQARAGRFFGTVVRTEALALGAVEVACLDGVIVGATIWYPPGRWTPGVHLRTLLGFVAPSAGGSARPPPWSRHWSGRIHGTRTGTCLPSGWTRPIRAAVSPGRCCGPG